MHPQEFNEPERYELHEGPYYHFAGNRREFLQVLGAGLLISVSGHTLFAQRSGRGRTAGPAERLHLGADGSITLLSGKVEVGQGSRTQLTQAAAEELHVAVDQIRLILADSEVVPDDGGTAGSRTTPSTVPAVRRACAAARQILLEAAAATFDVDAKTLIVRNGRIHGLNADQAFSYASLATKPHAEKFGSDMPDDVELTRVDQWTVLGTSVPKLSATHIVTGNHRFPSDVMRPGMLYGAVLRPPSYGAKLESIDLGPAPATVTTVRDGDFVGFAAPTSHAAAQARAAAAQTARWNQIDHPSSENLFDYLRTHVSSGRTRRQSRGEPEAQLKQAAQLLRETYQVAYIQHAPMEPRAALAEWADGRLTVWTGTQQPSRVRDELARAFHLDRDQVRVVVPDTGGGFGGKHTGEAALEAARLAQAANRPVAVRWSREDEFTWAYFRPAGVIDLAGALDDQGRLVVWEHINFNSGASALDTPYRVPNVATEFKNCDQPLRSGSYRALASTANAFARESFMDELATASQADPLQFRLDHLENDRLRAVLTAATDQFNWKTRWRPQTTPQLIGVGLGCGTEKGSYVATCAQVEIDPATGTFRVVRATTAFECGALHNPDNTKAQVEGCVIQGLGAILNEEITFKNGQILNPRFSQYRVPRFQHVPDLHTILLNRPDLLSVGSGETPIIGIAPAVANALFNAVGVRIRSLPLRNDRYRSA